MAIPTQNVFGSTQVAETFERYPEKQRKKLLILRQLILDTAKSLREDYLQQDALIDIDSYTSFKKQDTMLSTILHFHQKMNEAVEAGVESAKIKSGPNGAISLTLVPCIIATSAPFFPLASLLVTMV